MALKHIGSHPFSARSAGPALLALALSCLSLPAYAGNCDTVANKVKDTSDPLNFSNTAILECPDGPNRGNCKDPSALGGPITGCLLEGGEPPIILRPSGGVANTNDTMGSAVMTGQCQPGLDNFDPLSGPTCPVFKSNTLLALPTWADTQNYLQGTLPSLNLGLCSTLLSTPTFSGSATPTSATGTATIPCIGTISLNVKLGINICPFSLASVNNLLPKLPCGAALSLYGNKTTSPSSINLGNGLSISMTSASANAVSNSTASQTLNNPSSASGCSGTALQLPQNALHVVLPSTTDTLPVTPDFTPPAGSLLSIPGIPAPPPNANGSSQPTPPSPVNLDPSKLTSIVFPEGATFSLQGYSTSSTIGSFPPTSGLTVTNVPASNDPSCTPTRDPGTGKVTLPPVATCGGTTITSSDSRCSQPGASCPTASFNTPTTSNVVLGDLITIPAGGTLQKLANGDVQVLDAAQNIVPLYISAAAGAVQSVSLGSMTSLPINASALSLPPSLNIKLPINMNPNSPNSTVILPQVPNVILSCH